MKNSRHITGAALLLAALASGTAAAETISVTCGTTGKSYEFCKNLAEEWGKKTGNTVNIVSLPSSSSEQLALFQQMLAAGSSDIDVYDIDVVWPGMLGTHFIDLTPYTKGAEKEHFPAIVANNTRDGKLLAMPNVTDGGVLFYRKDLLAKYGEAVPETWEQLTATAKKIQDAERKAGNDKMWGFVFQGKPYEGLTCNAVEWLSSFGAGNIVEPDGKVSVNNPQAVKALETAASWVTTIAPQGVLNYTEEEGRGVFQSGNAVFMRNWPYAWALAQGEGSPVKDKVGVVALPQGGADGKHVATLGGWQSAVSKYSKHPEIAADYVMFVTSKEVQKRRAIALGSQPTIPALYKDPDVIAANPFFATLYDLFAAAVARPSTATGNKYSQVSNEFWNATFDVISGKASAKDSLAALEGKLNRMSRGGKW